MNVPAPKSPALHEVMPPRPAPAPRAGWEVAPPDFVGVGAMKSGTTWWWSVITSHPGVVSPREPADTPSTRPTDDPRSRNDEIYGAKETHFFDHYGGVADVDPRLYHRYFPRPPGQIAGEWTARYMYEFWIPPMLRRAAPKARVLVLLRDPVARLASALSHQLAWRGEIDAAAVGHQFRRGLYWQQLHHLLGYFDRSQVLVLQYERCVADTATQAARTFAFLGLDPGRWRLDSVQRERSGPRHPRHDLPPRTSDALRRAYRDDVRLLHQEFPDLDMELWPTMTE